MEKLFFNGHCSEYEMRYNLMDLGTEIAAKKEEINSLKERSQSIHAKFKADMARHEQDLAEVRNQHSSLLADLNEVGAELQMKTQLINEKTNVIHSLELSVNKLQGQSIEAQKELEETKVKLTEKSSELEQTEKLISKYIDNLEGMRADELDMIKNLEKISEDTQDEKENVNVMFN